MIDDVRLFLEPQIGYLAKTNGEPLWLHHFTVYKVCMRLIELLPRFPEELLAPLQLACLTHDIGKMRKEAQQTLESGGKDKRVVHKLKYEELLDYIEKAKGLAYMPSEAQIKSAYDIAVTHHSVSDEDIICNSTAYAGSGILLLRVSDWLASMEQLDVETIERVTSMFTLPGTPEPLLQLTYFEIGREPGPSTSLIASKTLEAFEEYGYSRLILFPNAAVMAKRGGSVYPERSDIAQSVYIEVGKSTLSNISPDYGTKQLLIGFCGELPDEYLAVHKDRIIEDLSRVDTTPSAFFKLLSEIMKLLGYGPSSGQNKWQMNVVHGVVIGRSAVPKAAEEWLLRTGEQLPKKAGGTVDRRLALAHLMDTLKLEDLLNDTVLDRLARQEKLLGESVLREKLCDLKGEELFNILFVLAQVAREKTRDADGRLHEIAAMISFPVEEDFKQIAADRLQAYKRYKKNPNPETGVCEMCGSVFTQKPGKEAPDGCIQCFSYIKSCPDLPRAICYLCAFDLSLVRSDTSGKNVSITIWITSKVELELEDKLFDIIKRAESSFYNPRCLTEMVDLRDGLNFPLPRKLKLPLSKNDAQLRDGIAENVTFFQTPFGIFARLRTVRAPFSVKNYRALYAPLYDLMNLLGFNVCITNDLEFRYGLFGERRVSTSESYNDSIATLLLAKTFPQNKRNPHCMAAAIIAAEPSLAVAKALECDDRGRPLLSKEQLESYLASLLRANRQIVKGGLITMGDLLQDAAFFARNLPVYCVEPEDRKAFWAELTKHKATKAVLAPLNEMMHGRDFDQAMSKFLSQLSVKISKEEREDMDNFVRKSREILERYYNLRQQSFSGFLKAKNALMNAIYAFMRYKDLDRVFET
ncbi:MAG: hypothetical protein QXG33_04240 [Candidatus Anstonellales archaeon]